MKEEILKIIVASATHLFCDLKDHFSGKIRDDPSGHFTFSGKIRDDPSGHFTFSGKIRDDPSGHFTSDLSLSVKGDLSIDHI